MIDVSGESFLFVDGMRVEFFWLWQVGIGVGR